MSTTTNTIELELAYTDHSERTYKIPFQNLSQEGVEASRQAIRDFNTAAADATSAVAQTFLSNDGFPVARIMTAVIINKVEDVIYSG